MGILYISHMEIGICQRMQGYIGVKEYKNYSQLKDVELFNNEIGALLRGTNSVRLVVLEDE